MTKLHVTDSDLIQAYKSGNQNALGELLGRYQSMLFGYLLKMTRNKADAEDLFQETCLKVIKGMNNYQEQQYFKSYLFKVAVNLCIDSSRRRKTRKSTVVEDNPDMTIEQTAGTDASWLPDSILEKEQIQEVLTQAVDRLPDSQREVVLLRLETGMTFQQIADLRGEPIGTILPRMHRATKAIRSFFVESGYGYE
jgi:RNA polymerase sigma-70 factor, ECF subfamily